MQSSNTPSKIPLPFASDVSALKNTIPENSADAPNPNNASYQLGFPPITMLPIESGGLPFYGQDMNGILNALSSAARWANAGGSYKYDATFANDTNVGGYPKGALLIKSGLGGFWFNTVENNTSNPDTGGAGWVDFSSILTNIPTQTSIADLRTRPKTGPAFCFVSGYYSSGDGGGGMYYYDASDVASADNGGTIIVASDGGRWKLINTGTVSIRQFGVLPANTAAVNTPLMQAAVTWATTTTSRILFAPAGTYNFNAAIVKASSFIGLQMRGEGMRSTIFNWSSADGLQIVGGSGQLCNAAIEDIGFTGVASSTIGVAIIGQCGQKLIRCMFDSLYVGLRFWNRDTGMFTEYCHAQDCDFTSNCANPVHYRKSSGDISFHGSGLTGMCTVNIASGQVVLVDLNAQPYNAPMFVQVWGNGSATIINNQNTGGGARVDFYGQINTERFVGTLTLASSVGQLNWPVYFVGKCCFHNETVAFGTLVLCDWVAKTSVGSYQLSGARYSVKQAAVTGANTIVMPYPMYEGAISYYIRISGNGYDYRYKVDTFNAAAVASVTYLTTNSAGYGPPTFSMSGGQLVLTNASYPATGLTIFVDAIQNAQSVYQSFIGG